MTEANETTQLRRYHCAYHKCLTIYVTRVMHRLYNRIFTSKGGYKQFKSLIDEFYAAVGDYRVMAVNNHALDLDRLGSDFRISRFIRDPRDLVVSGLHYHRRGAESWCNVVDPTPEDFAVVNGVVPDDMKPGQSFAEYLQSLSDEEGLIAEIRFRERHFRSMMQWPETDTRIRTFRYEDIMGHEVETFAAVFDHYELPWPHKLIGRWLAYRFSAKNQRGKMRHIRNPEPNQWRKSFTTRVEGFFNERHRPTLERYRYDL